MTDAVHTMREILEKVIKRLEARLQSRLITYPDFKYAVEFLTSHMIRQATPISTSEKELLARGQKVRDLCERYRQTGESALQEYKQILGGAVQKDEHIKFELDMSDAEIERLNKRWSERTEDKLRDGQSYNSVMIKLDPRLDPLFDTFEHLNNPEPLPEILVCSFCHSKVERITSTAFKKPVVIKTMEIEERDGEIEAVWKYKHFQQDHLACQSCCLKIPKGQTKMVSLEEM